MMRYHRGNSTFIPKEIRDAIALDIESYAKEKKKLQHENEKLSNTVEELTKKINQLKSTIELKDQKAQSSNNIIIDLEKKIKNMESVEKHSLSKEVFIAEIKELKSENSKLKDEVESYKDHVQFLYILIVILSMF